MTAGLASGRYLHKAPHACWSAGFILPKTVEKWGGRFSLFLTLSPYKADAHLSTVRYKQDAHLSSSLTGFRAAGVRRTAPRRPTMVNTMRITRRNTLRKRRGAGGASISTRPFGGSECAVSGLGGACARCRRVPRAAGAGGGGVRSAGEEPKRMGWRGGAQCSVLQLFRHSNSPAANLAAHATLSSHHSPPDIWFSELHYLYFTRAPAAHTPPPPRLAVPRYAATPPGPQGTCSGRSERLVSLGGGRERAQYGDA